MTLQVHSSSRHLFFGCADVIGEVVGGYLDTASVLAMALVCKQWNEFLKSQTDEGVPKGALAVKTAALREYVQHGFGANKWKHYFGEVERRPLPLKVLGILKALSSSSCGAPYLFLWPQTVDEKPLTLNRLEELMKNPKKDSGNPSQYSDFSDAVENLYEVQKPDDLLNESQWIFMIIDTQCRSLRRRSVMTWRF